MANQPNLAGLFGGPQSSAADFLDNRDAQRRARIQQAMQNYRGSGTAMAAAAANQRGREAFTNMGRAALGSQGLGVSGMEDPKLASARKRDTDRREMQEMLKGMDTDGDGKISEGEYNIVIREFDSRGYPEEAARIRKQMADEFGTGYQQKTDAAKKTEADTQRGFLGDQATLDRNQRDLLSQRDDVTRRLQIALDSTNKAAERELRKELSVIENNLKLTMQGKDIAFRKEQGAADRAVTTRQQDITKDIAGDRLSFDRYATDKGFRFKLQSLDQQQDQFDTDMDFRRDVFKNSKKVSERDFRWKKYLDKHNIEMSERSADLAYDVYSFNRSMGIKKFDAARDQEKVDNFLKKRQVILSENDSAWQQKNAGERLALAAKTHADDVKLGLAGLSLQKQSMIIDEKLRSRGLDIQEIGMAQKRELFGLQLEADALKLKMEGIVKPDQVRDVSQNRLDEVSAIIDGNDKYAQFKKDGDWFSMNNDHKVEIASKVNQLMAGDRNLSVQAAIDLAFGGTSTSAGVDEFAQ